MITAIPILERRGGAPPPVAVPADPLLGLRSDGAVDVRAVLDRAVLTGPHTEARITVVCEVATAPVDPATLQQVVTQLLHLEDELPEGTSVWVTAVPADSGLVVTVEDDAPAVQAHAPRPATDRGAPLRLARVCQLARRHGGEMWIEQAPGGGLCYVVTLPALPGS